MARLLLASLADAEGLGQVVDCGGRVLVVEGARRILAHLLHLRHLLGRQDRRPPGKYLWFLSRKFWCQTYPAGAVEGGAALKPPCSPGAG